MSTELPWWCLCNAIGATKTCSNHYSWSKGKITVHEGRERIPLRQNGWLLFFFVFTLFFDLFKSNKVTSRRNRQIELFTDTSRASLGEMYVSMNLKRLWGVGDRMNRKAEVWQHPARKHQSMLFHVTHASCPHVSSKDMPAWLLEKNWKMYGVQRVQEDLCRTQARQAQCARGYNQFSVWVPTSKIKMHHSALCPSLGYSFLPSGDIGMVVILLRDFSDVDSCWLQRQFSQLQTQSRTLVTSAQLAPIQS